MNTKQDIQAIALTELETVTGGGTTVHYPLGGRVEINQNFNLPKTFTWSHPFWGTFSWGG